MIDLFFDALNVKNPLEGKLKRKPFRLPYYSYQDERFKVCIGNYDCNMNSSTTVFLLFSVATE